MSRRPPLQPTGRGGLEGAGISAADHRRLRDHAPPFFDPGREGALGFACPETLSTFMGGRCNGHAENDMTA